MPNLDPQELDVTTASIRQTKRHLAKAFGYGRYVWNAALGDCQTRVVVCDACGGQQGRKYF